MVGLVLFASMLGLILGRRQPDADDAANVKQPTPPTDDTRPSRAVRLPAAQRKSEPSSLQTAPAQPELGPFKELPAAEFFPRPEDEWQGMLVNQVHRQVCERTPDCGLALACRPDGKCGPCEEDGDCAKGEACALDHCLPATLVTCRSRRDCASAGVGALCVLSGITGNEPRGNSRTRSYCLAAGQPLIAKQDADEARSVLEAAQGGPYERPAVTEGDLISILRSAREARPAK